MEAALLVSLLLFGELVLAYAAQGADPILGKIFKRSARGDSIVRITHLGIVNIATYIANILLHFFYLSFLMIVFPNTWIL